MPKFNHRPPSHSQDLTAKQAIAGADAKTANGNIAVKREGRNSLLTEVARSSRKQSAGAGTSIATPVEPKVNTPSENHPEQSSGPAVGISDQLTPEKLFASFELQRELENGRTGAVWLAHDYSPRRQVEQVALKFLPDSIVSGKIAIEDLKAEIRRRIALKHPNILRVYDLVESKGRVAIQMEYLEGQSLSRLRATKPNQVFEVRDLENWVNVLCEALKYHHNAGLVAGDILPDNLIVDPAGNLKLKEFGIANCITDSMSRLMLIQDTSETLSYQSPQRASGQRPAVADDLYSLGANIYELLTGKPPFYAGDIRDQVNGKIPPLMGERRAELGIKGDAIPKCWEETVAACLAKDPAQRPESAAEVQKRLRNASIPSSSTDQSDPKSLPKSKSPPETRPTRRRWLWTSGIFFILAVGSAAAFLSFHRTGRPVPSNGTFPTSAIPLSSSGKESYALATPSPEASPVRTSQVNPAPTPETNQAPIPEAGLVLTAETSPAPSPEASPVLTTEANPIPTPNADQTSPASSPVASPAPTMAAIPTPSPEMIATSSPESGRTLPPEETTVPKQVPEPSPTPLSQHDIDATRQAVINRINALPGVTAQRKANLIEKMNKARSMERLMIIRFDTGRTTLRRTATDELLKVFSSPETHERLSDPTTIVVVAGYADTVGGADKNLRYSQERAENVTKILKEQAKLLNAMQTIGMGGTELLDSKRPDQNRVVEVWAVVPL